MSSSKFNVGDKVEILYGSVWKKATIKKELALNFHHLRADDGNVYDWHTAGNDTRAAGFYPTKYEIEVFDEQV